MEEKGRHGATGREAELLERQDGPYGRWKRVQIGGPAHNLVEAMGWVSKSIEDEYPEAQYALVALDQSGYYSAWVRRGNK